MPSKRFIPLSYSCYIEATRGLGGEIGLSDPLGFTLSHELVQILYLTPNQCQWGQATQ